ncbi:hypothetical protein BBJ28_00019589 [Nothophytophthora sp. Chile5]|nr:hypothetical protein BBJ28_00019589 [Nothophytophthora sp. Chile5]
MNDGRTPATLVNWDFLSPWCDELRGRLLMNDGYVQVLREKPPSVYECESEDEEDKREEDEENEQVTEARLEASYIRTREALELLVLLAHVDKAAWHMLLTERCNLRFDDEINYTNWEEESGDVDTDMEREGERASNGGERDSDEAHGDAASDLVEDVANWERQLERERDLLVPQFYFSSDYLELNRTERPSLGGWRALFLAISPGSHSQPSAAYEKAKAQILAMQADDIKARPRISSALEIPVLLGLGPWSLKQEKVTDCLRELVGFIQTMQSQAQQLEDLPAMKTDVNEECASTYVYRLRHLTLQLGGAIITELFATRLLAVLGAGIPLMGLKLSLNAWFKPGDDNMPTREALAKVLNGIFLRRLDPTNEESQSPGWLEIDCSGAHTWQLKALCSALAVARVPLLEVHVSCLFPYRSTVAARRVIWRMLAHALFRTRSCKGGRFSSMRDLMLSCAVLTMEDLAEITYVLNEKERHETTARSWKICRQRWMLREGTLLQLLDRDGEEGNATVSESVTLAFDTHVELMVEHPDEEPGDDGSEWLDVIVPAYGECRVLREAFVAVSTDETEERGEPLRSLSLSCSTKSDGLGGFLELVGWSLHSLSLTLHQEMDANALVPTILSSCPLLTKLELADCDIDLDSFAAAYEQIGEDTGLAISSLVFQDSYGVGEGNGMLFAQQLGDPTSRLARHLREVSILVDEDTEQLVDQLLNELWLALGKNHKLVKFELTALQPRSGPDWKKRFRQFDGQVLPPRPLAANCKLAFLSVARDPEGESGSNRQSAVQRLDRPILSLIFELAGTRVIRSVKVDCEAY